MSVAMDSYFLRFDRIRSYYLGQKTFELNRIRAEREIERLNAEKKRRSGTKRSWKGRRAGWRRIGNFSVNTIMTRIRSTRKQQSRPENPRPNWKV